MHALSIMQHQNPGLRTFAQILWVDNSYVWNQKELFPSLSLSLSLSPSLVYFSRECVVKCCRRLINHPWRSPSPILPNSYYLLSYYATKFTLHIPGPKKEKKKRKERKLPLTEPYLWTLSIFLTLTTLSFNIINLLNLD